jgi:hypothetical protein
MNEIIQYQCTRCGAIYVDKTMALLCENSLTDPMPTQSTITVIGYPDNRKYKRKVDYWKLMPIYGDKLHNVMINDKHYYNTVMHEWVAVFKNPVPISEDHITYEYPVHVYVRNYGL